MNRQPEIRRAGFARGLRWLLFGAELLGRGLRTLVPVAGLLLLVMMIQIVPLIGPAVLALLTPLLTAGLLAAFHKAARSESAGPGVLFAGWVDERSRIPLLLLGLWLMAGFLLAVLLLGLWIAPQVEETALEAAMDDPESMVRLLMGLDLAGGVVLAGLIVGVVLGGLYFAVPLVYFAHWPAGVSLFRSLKALVVNWAAFLGLFVAMLVLFMGLFVIVGVLAMILGLALGPAGEFLIRIISILTGLFVQVLLAGAQYVAFREVFVWPESEDGSPESGDVGDSGQIEV